MTLDTIDYVVPATLDEALKLLRERPGSVAIAGGNGLITRLKRGEATAAVLVDLRRLDELRTLVSVGDGRLRIGALTTLSGLLADPVLRAAHVPGVLADAVSMIGDVQLRNRATIGGTLASAEPGSDLSAALLALEASMTVAGRAGRRTVPVERFLAGGSPLERGELIVSVDVAPAEPGSAYEKFTDRANLQAICGVAVTVNLSAAGPVRGCRIAVAGAMPFPRRLPEVENAVVGAALPVLVPPLDPGSFLGTAGASAQYLAALTRVLAERAIGTAVERAQRL
jgi:carbon-monoxide dehydrogenase medium subunit